MAGPLTDAEQTGLFGDTSKPAPIVPASAAPTAAPQPTTSPLTTQQQQALFGDTSKPAPAPAPSGGTSGSTLGDWANAFQAGTYRGLANVVNAPSAWFGLNPLIDTEGSLLTTSEKQAAQAHPVVAGVGQGFGQAVGTAPLLLAAPEASAFKGVGLGGAGWVPSLARGAITGAGVGAAQNVLTAGENPQEDLLTRAERGAKWGGALGLLGGAIEPAFGAAATITPEVQAAGKRMAQAKVPVTGANLTSGAAATQDTVQQANKAWGNIFGQTTPNFSDTTLNTVMPKLGQDVGNAMSAGQVHAGAVLPDTGQTVIDTLNEIKNDYPQIPQVQRLVRNAVAKFDPQTAVMDGSDLGDMIRYNTQLDKATRATGAEVNDAANRIKSALLDGFDQSSPPGVSQAASLAREKYKLAIAAKENADPQGNLVLGKLYSSLEKTYGGDISQMGSGSSLSDQAVQFARDADLLYGGPKAKLPAGGAWDLGSIGTGGGMGYLASHALPSMFVNPLVTTAAIAAPIAGRALQRAGQRYQMGSAFGNALLQRGAQAPGPYLASPLAAAGTALMPQGQVRRRTQ